MFFSQPLGHFFSSKVTKSRGVDVRVQKSVAQESKAAQKYADASSSAALSPPFDDALLHRYALALPTLNVPMALTTTVGRPWLVPLMALPVWARWAAFFPALMSTVLLFMDQNITVRLVNSKQHKLKKG